MNDYVERLKNEDMNELSAWIKVNKWSKRVNEMSEWMNESEWWYRMDEKWEMNDLMNKLSGWIKMKQWLNAVNKQVNKWPIKVNRVRRLSVNNYFFPDWFVLVRRSRLI